MTRTDLGFLTRRSPRPEAHSPTQQRPAGTGTIPSSTGVAPRPGEARASLVLRRPADEPTDSPGNAPQALSAAPPPPRLAPIPIAQDNRALTDAAPVIRLAVITSGIGSLRIGHADAAVWETTDLAGAPVDGDPRAPSFGNRPLIERDGTDLLISLRHIRTLRRLIVAGTDSTIRTIAGVTITNPGTAVTTISVIDGQIELRREPATTDLQTTFNIGVVA